MTTENPTYHFAGFDYNYQTVEALKPSGLVALYNQLTGRATKKFASRAKGIQQTWEALAANGVAVQKVPAGQTAKRAQRGQKKAGRKAQRKQTVARSPRPAEGPMAVALGLLAQKGGAHLDDLMEATGLPQRGVGSLIDRARRRGTKIEKMGRKTWRVA